MIHSDENKLQFLFSGNRRSLTKDAVLAMKPNSLFFINIKSNSQKFLQLLSINPNYQFSFSDIIKILYHIPSFYKFKIKCTDFSLDEQDEQNQQDQQNQQNQQKNKSRNVEKKKPKRNINIEKPYKLIVCKSENENFKKFEIDLYYLSNKNTFLIFMNFYPSTFQIINDKIFKDINEIKPENNNKIQMIKERKDERYLLVEIFDIISFQSLSPNSLIETSDFVKIFIRHCLNKKTRITIDSIDEQIFKPLSINKKSYRQYIIKKRKLNDLMMQINNLKGKTYIQLVDFLLDGIKFDNKYLFTLCYFYPFAYDLLQWALENNNLDFQIDTSFKMLKPYVFGFLMLIVSHCGIIIGFVIGPSEKASLYQILYDNLIKFFNENNPIELEKFKSELFFESDNGSALKSFYEKNNLNYAFCHVHLKRCFGITSYYYPYLSQILNCKSLDSYNNKRKEIIELFIKVFNGDNPNNLKIKPDDKHLFVLKKFYLHCEINQNSITKKYECIIILLTNDDLKNDHWPLWLRRSLPPDNNNIESCHWNFKEESEELSFEQISFSIRFGIFTENGKLFSIGYTKRKYLPFIHLIKKVFECYKFEFDNIEFNFNHINDINYNPNCDMNIYCLQSFGCNGCYDIWKNIFKNCYTDKDFMQIIIKYNNILNEKNFLPKVILQSNEILKKEYTINENNLEISNVENNNNWNINLKKKKLLSNYDIMIDDDLINVLIKYGLNAIQKSINFESCKYFTNLLLSITPENIINIINENIQKNSKEFNEFKNLIHSEFFDDNNKIKPEKLIEINNKLNNFKDFSLTNNKNYNLIYNNMSKYFKKDFKTLDQKFKTTFKKLMNIIENDNSIETDNSIENDSIENNNDEPILEMEDNINRNIGINDIEKINLLDMKYNNFQNLFDMN